MALKRLRLEKDLPRRIPAVDRLLPELGGSNSSVRGKRVETDYTRCYFITREAEGAGGVSRHRRPSGHGVPTLSGVRPSTSSGRTEQCLRDVIGNCVEAVPVAVGIHLVQDRLHLP